VSRNAVAAKRRKQRVRAEDLAPGIAEGITIGASEQEALAAHPIKKISPLEHRLGHMREDAPSRVRFVAEPNEAIVDFGDGRKMHDVDVVVTEATKRQMLAGYKCLRCHEPQETSFPKYCDLCGYPMGDRQIMDAALEFDGERHLGPRKPMREILDEQDARIEKEKFDCAIAEGRSPMKGLR
jgi:hypothetical protein